MIRCGRAPEPAHFDREVRAPGRKWLASHDVGRPKDYWRVVRGELAAAFQHRCAYAGMYIPSRLGTVDHFDASRSLLYEWDNLRYASGWINSSKQNIPAERLLDPCEVEDGWFELLLPSMWIRVTGACPEGLRARAEYTLDRLGLRHESLMHTRSEWWRLYVEGLMALALLDRWDPLLARAIRAHAAVPG